MLAVFTSLLLSGPADADPCALALITPLDGGIAVVLGDRELPRDALVQSVFDDSCLDGMPVRVRSLPDQYRSGDQPRVAVGDLACVAPDVLRPPDHALWMARSSLDRPDGPVAHQPPGRLLGPLTRCTDTTVTLGRTATTTETTLPIDQVGNLRPIEATTLAAVHRVQAQAMVHGGPVGIEQVGWTHTGRVSLPWTWLDDDAVRAEHVREGLLIGEQKERALAAVGPADLWLHFTGSDPDRSDVWGEPDAVVALIDLAASWKTVCEALPARSPGACALQLGDMAWYDDRRPDPLGHKDHYQGRCVDIRLFRSDASRYEAWWNRDDDRPGWASAYDRALTGAFVANALARNDVDKVLFNDPKVNGATPARGHDDHLHLCFAPTPQAP